MFLKIEGGAIINVDLISRVDINEMKKTATALSGSATLAQESRVLYEYFRQDRIYLDPVPEPESVQVGQPQEGLKT
jgi:hypothetical protein